ncbi:hypothetical protein GC177_09515 [bacterium]|nr:hypothetical protein [bacterium]
MDEQKPVILLAVRANKSLRNGHVKLCIYVPDENEALIAALQAHIDERDEHRAGELGIEERKIRFRDMQCGKLLDINVQAKTVVDGILSIFRSGIEAEVVADDGHEGAVRAFAAIPATEAEVEDVLDMLYGKPFDYHLISTAAAGNNCVTLPNRALNAVSIGLYAALGLEDNHGIQRPQSVADAIVKRVQEALEHRKQQISIPDHLPPATITLAEHELAHTLGRNLWVGHVEGQKGKEHVPMHEVIKTLEQQRILQHVSLSPVSSSYNPIVLKTQMDSGTGQIIL